MNTIIRNRLIAAGLGIVVAMVGATGAVSAKGSDIGLETSLKFIDQAKKAATAMHVRIAVAIVDMGGNLVAFQKMDGTQLGSIELALRKAKTAVSFVRPTSDLEHALNGGNYMIATLPNALPAGGGYPIVINNEVVGALGLSGGEGETDARLAQLTVTTVLQAAKPRDH